MASNSVNYRPEIDGLRAIAVLLVLASHAQVGPFSGGFIGVDVFFVISGYLITTIITRDLAVERFSYRQFVERRARRLIPALYALLVPVTIAAHFLLAELDRVTYMKSLISTVTFWSNIRFYLDVGYFDIAAAYKPLLHTWSLGIEEQFYLLFPLLMVFVRKVLWRYRLLMIFALLLGSFVFQQSASLAAGFYLLPQRAWELLVGVFAATLASSEKWAIITRRITAGDIVKQVLSLCSFVSILLAAIFLPKDSVWPSDLILIPALGTAVILLTTTSDSTLGKFLTLRPLKLVGLCSYSVYLWHYPIFSLVRYRTIGEIDLSASILLIGIALGMGWISWQFVERPFRESRVVSRNGLITFSALGGLLLVVVAVISSESTQRMFLAEQTASIEIETQIVLIGDSHAAHLIPGLMPYFGDSLEAATSAGCVPIRGVDRFDSRFTPGTCASFIDQTFNQVLAARQVEVVLLASMGPVYLTGTAFRGLDLARVTGDGLVLVDKPEVTDRWTVYEVGLRKTLHELQRAGKKVIFVVDVPELGIEPQFCNPSEPATCQNSRAEIDARIDRYRNLVASVTEEFDNVVLFDPTDLFCGDSKCEGVKNGKRLYSDIDHLSDFGSEYVSSSLAPLVAQLLGKG